MSVANDIGTLTVTAIRAIGLETSTGVELDDANVVLRKKLELAPKEEPPKVLVVVGEEGEVERLTARTKLKRWPVSVAVVTAGGNKLQDDTRLRTWREEIESKLHDDRTTFAGLTGFNLCTAEGLAPFDPGALGKDVVWSLQRFIIEVIEATT